MDISEYLGEKELVALIHILLQLLLLNGDTVGFLNKIIIIIHYKLFK
jgi:hypothetical protein